MLERIEIENLGSIRKTGMSLSPLTVLLGANASGKTTVMRGIEFFASLRTLPWQEVRYAGHTLAGSHWSRIIHGGDTAGRLIFRGSTQPQASEAECELQLGIDWEQVRSNIMTQPETEQRPRPELLNQKLRDPQWGWIIAGSGPDILSPPQRQLPLIALPRPQQLTLTRLLFQLGSLPPSQEQMAELLQYLESFGTARYFRPDSATMLKSSLRANVSSEGSGFVAALATLQNRKVESFNHIEQQLRQLFPFIERIRFERSSGRFQQLVFETRRSRVLVPASLEADGVLTTLFLLWAGMTTPPHGTLLIDDPDAALHPHLMGKRVEFLRSLARGDLTGSPLRVVVATQSVDFVRWVELPEIRIVEHSAKTGTLVHPVPENETLRTLVDKFQANPGELWYSGTLGGVPDPDA